MNRKSAVSLLGASSLGLGLAVTAGVVALSSPAGAAPAAPHVAATASDYPPVVATSTPVEGESFSKAPTSATSTSTGTASSSTIVEGESTSRAAVAAVSDPGGRDDLPFTGADVAGISIVGAALVGGGGFLVVAGRRRRGAHR